MYQTLKLEKGMYTLSGKSFSQALEEADPSAAYKDTALAGLDAFERQLKRFDIRLNGIGCDKVDKFFTTTESAVLFPEFVRRTITQGMQESILQELAAVQTKVNGTTYLGCSVDEGDDGYDETTTEGTALPTTAIAQDTTQISLTKFGRLITASYEVIRQQRLDVFAVTLRAIGVKLANAITEAALTALTGAVTAGTLLDTAFSYDDLAALCGAFSDFDLTTVITTPALVADILSMEQMADCRASDAGQMQLPFGAKLLKSAQLAENTVVGIDRRYALELITGSDLIMETDKLIDSQLDRIAVSVNVGFKPLMTDAIKVISWTTT